MQIFEYLADSPMPTLLDLETTLGGGAKASQSYADLALWEYVLNLYPELKTIVELGTYQGGMSLWLKIQAVQRGMRFYTFDVSTAGPLRFDSPLAKLLKLEDDFIQCNVLDNNWVLDGVFERDGNFPMAVLCDGGNKPAEYARFSRKLRTDSLIAVHDWGTEIWLGHIDVDLTQPVYDNYAKSLGSVTRFFARR